jgi:1,2-diacylglycerol 3-alpha-glucosyltransferase
MRIGLLTDVYRPGFSGVANHVLLLKEAFEKLGHDVKVFAFERRPYACGDPQIIYSPGIILAANYPFGLRLSPNAATLLRTMDVVHIHQPFASGTAALNALKGCSIPLLFTSHTRYDLYTKSYLPFLPYSLTSAVIRRYMRSFGRRMTHIIAPSPSMAALLKAWGVQAPIEVIPNGIQLHNFRPNPERRSALRQALALPEDAFLYIFVGRIADEKNIGFLLRSFQLISEKQTRAGLVLVGGGPKFAQMQADIQSSSLAGRVWMTGPVAYAQVGEYLRAADVFVTASKTEVHPLTVIEAGASGLPVIGLKAPGVAEIVLDGKTGFIAPENEEDFGSLMLALAHDAALCKILSINSRKEALTYSYERTGERVLERYEAVLKQRN